MTSERIIDVSMEYFSELGYAGTTFTLIAKAVGIKKQSIYAHFTSKEHLYFTCFERALEIEKNRAQKYQRQLAQRIDLLHVKAILREYILENQYRNTVLFLYKAGLVAPHEYQLQSQTYIAKYRESMLAIFRPWLLLMKAENAAQKQNAIDIIEVLFCLYDGCMIELVLNGKQAFQKRFDSVWSLFWESIVQKIE
ncbi:MAG: TetR/AcrR family transcriptional regulator [Culicoidibacterales bacterium]